MNIGTLTASLSGPWAFRTWEDKIGLKGAKARGEREAWAKSSYVFAHEEGIGPSSTFTLEEYNRVREALKPHESVIHSFRHTFDPRFGETEADAFTIMRANGHSSVTVGQKYMCATPEAMEHS